MRQVIAVLEHGDDAQVRAAATAVADLFGADVVDFRVGPGDPAERTQQVREALTGAGVVAAAMSARESEPLCWNVLTNVSVPVIVVPSHGTRTLRRISRVLVPLDGSAEAAASVRELAGRAVAAGAEVVAVHVFTNATVPRFWDQAAHTRGTWSREFLERNLPEGVQLDLRHGRPAEEVLAEAAHAGADLVILSWSQNLGDGHARTVCHSITDGTVPVLLIATNQGPSQVSSGPSTLLTPP